MNKTIETVWKEQAENAIKQGQNMIDFLLHCHPSNRAHARQGYIAAIAKAEGSDQ